MSPESGLFTEEFGPQAVRALAVIPVAAAVQSFTAEVLFPALDEA